MPIAAAMFIALSAGLCSLRDSSASLSKQMLRLPFGVKDLFADWLERHYPDRKERVLGRVRSVRGGALYKAGFGARMKGEGAWAKLIGQVFDLHKRRLAFPGLPKLSSASFRRPGERQGELFG